VVTLGETESPEGTLGEGTKRLGALSVEHWWFGLMTTLGPHLPALPLCEVCQTGISMVDGDSGGVSPGAVKQALPTFATTIQGVSGQDATWNWDLAWYGTQKFTDANNLALANHAVTLWNAIKALAPTDSRLTSVRISAFGTDKKVINGANVYTLKTPVAGTGTASTQMPAQIAITASLRTGARGAAGRGRMFLPLHAGSTATGLIGSTNKNTVGNGVSDFVENIRAVGPLAAIVNPTPLTYSDIDDVQVGNFYDTQRRRENAMDETYTSFPPTLS